MAGVPAKIDRSTSLKKASSFSATLSLCIRTFAFVQATTLITMRSSAALTLLAGLSIVSALPAVIEVRQDVQVDGYTCTGDLIDTGSSELYACSDDRLGPAVLPGADVQPLGAAVANYKRFGNLTITEFLNKYWNASLNDQGQVTGWTYPPKNGFVLDIDEWPIKSTVKVEAGTYVDRFGPPTGKNI